jgi:hypothetical protein
MGGSTVKQTRDDDSGSSASFEEVSRKNTMVDSVIPDVKITEDAPKTHKIQGKIPEVLYVLQYLGFANKVIESTYHMIQHLRRLLTMLQPVRARTPSM